MLIIILLTFVALYIAFYNLLSPLLKATKSPKKMKDIEEIMISQRRSQIVKSRTSPYKKFKQKILDTILQANLKLKLEEFYAISLLCASVGWILGSLFRNILLSIILGCAFLTLPYFYISALAARYRAKVQGSPLEHALSLIIATLIQKNDTVTAIKDNLYKIDEPLRSYFTEFINNVEKLGIPYKRAITDLARKINSVDFSNFARLSIIFEEKGGDTKYTLMNIPDDMRDKKIIQSEVSSDIDSVNILGIVFALLVPLTLLGMRLTNYEFYAILTDTTIGKVTMAIVAILLIIFIFLISSLNKAIKTL